MTNSDIQNRKNSEVVLKLKEIRTTLTNCNYIKYAAYRAASKLRIFQKAFFMEKIPFSLIANVFEKHNFSKEQNFLTLNQTDLELLLHDIYFIVQKQNKLELDINFLSQLWNELLLNVYARQKHSSLQVFSFKVLIVLLSEAKPREKYQYFFHNLADENHCLSKKSLQILLSNLLKVIDYIEEKFSFGPDLIPGTIESCFRVNSKCVAISEDDFMAWLVQDPQFLVWLSTLYRIQISESASHNAKCEICKNFPIIGLRYRCLKCFSYDLCQSCFFNGKFNKKHKLKHPIHEYCFPMTVQQCTKTFLLTIKNILCKKDLRLQYLPVLRVDPLEGANYDTMFFEGHVYQSKKSIDDVEVICTKLSFKKLQSVILQLERECEKLILQVENLSEVIKNSGLGMKESKFDEHFLNHKKQLENQVTLLKLLKRYLLESYSSQSNKVIASTPVNNQFLKIKKKVCHDSLENLSAIEELDSYNFTQNSYSMKPEKKLLWDNYDLANFNELSSWQEMSHALSKAFLESSKEHSFFENTCLKKSDNNEIVIHSWLGGQSHLESSVDFTRKGLSWLRDKDENTNHSNNEDFEELKIHLKKVLSELKNLSESICREEGENINQTNSEVETTQKVNSLLFDLIIGSEKLIGKNDGTDFLKN